MYTDIFLVITCVDWSSGSYYVVSSYKNVFHCPKKQLDTSNCDDDLIELAKDLYEDTVEVDRSWSNIRINKVKVKQKEGVMNVIYEANVPFNTKLCNCHWLPIGEVKDNDIVKTAVLDSVRGIAA